MIILDTDHVTLIEQALSGPGARIRARLRAANDRVATTVITYEEQTRGWFSVLAKAKTLVEEIQAYDRLLHHLEKYKGMDVLRFDELAATQYQHLRSLKLRVATMDLKIAAIALANNATLFTRNLRDFSRIPDLHAEDAAR